jgi:leader peptidase (prepilin peptidase)/N-methyltransferase
VFGFEAIKEGVAGILFLGAAWTDMRKMRIPNRLIGWAWLFRVLLFWMEEKLLGREALLQGKRELLGSLALMGGLTLFAALSARGLGFGDVKLLGAAALYLGLERTLFCLLHGLLLAGGLALSLILVGKIGRRSRLPLAPFLLVGYLSALFWEGC